LNQQILLGSASTRCT